MIVRIATADDARDAAREEPPGANVAQRHYARQRAGEALFLIARTTDRVLGAGLLVGTELRHLQVNPDARGRGVGAALIAAAEDLATEQGHDHLTLGVELDNSRARALYTRLGYAPSGRTETTTYSYVDPDGQRRSATETSAELCKALAPKE